jgi:hypothetical protein
MLDGCLEGARNALSPIQNWAIAAKAVQTRNERSLFFYSPCVINAQPQVGIQCALQLRISMLVGNL